MPIFKGRARSWEAYLAGFGASGALMAGGFVVFVGLIGLVTFNTWPHTGDVLAGEDGGAALQSSATARPLLAQHRTTLSLVRLLGPAPGSAIRNPSDGGPSIRHGGVPGSNVAPGGSGGGQAPIESPEPPSPPEAPNPVREVISGAGNAVQSNTDNLGNALGGSDGPGLGGVVGGVGRTLNSDLQSLAGSP
ncbi:MAG TPA: hypothetical protein VHU24_01290 [Solirubrobacterales bacterium]|nr:hypothetical protein [Solirubrobacterales bacterium]